MMIAGKKRQSRFKGEHRTKRQRTSRQAAVEASDTVDLSSCVDKKVGGEQILSNQNVNHGTSIENDDTVLCTRVLEDEAGGSEEANISSECQISSSDVPAYTANNENTFTENTRKSTTTGDSPSSEEVSITMVSSTEQFNLFTPPQNLDNELEIVSVNDATGDSRPKTIEIPAVIEHLEQLFGNIYRSRDDVLKTKCMFAVVKEAHTTGQSAEIAQLGGQAITSTNIISRSNYYKVVSSSAVASQSSIRPVVGFVNSHNYSSSTVTPYRFQSVQAYNQNGVRLAAAPSLLSPMFSNSLAQSSQTSNYTTVFVPDMTMVRSMRPNNQISPGGYPYSHPCGYAYGSAALPYPGGLNIQFPGVSMQCNPMNPPANMYMSGLLDGYGTRMDSLAVQTIVRDGVKHEPQIQASLMRHYVNSLYQQNSNQQVLMTSSPQQQQQQQQQHHKQPSDKHQFIHQHQLKQTVRESQQPQQVHHSVEHFNQQIQLRQSVMSNFLPAKQISSLIQNHTLSSLGNHNMYANNVVQHSVSSKNGSTVSDTFIDSQTGDGMDPVSRAVYDNFLGKLSPAPSQTTRKRTHGGSHFISTKQFKS